MNRLAFALLAAALALPACDSASDDEDTSASEGSTSSDDDGAEPVDFAADVQPILEGSCLCHFQNPSGEMEAPFMTLNEGMGLSQLVDVDSEQLPSMKRVAPGDPDNSYLVRKLRGTHIDAGGPADSDPMPPLGPLPETDIVTIETWISEGAQG